MSTGHNSKLEDHILITGIGDASKFSDPAFYLNKQQPIHRWAPWIAGFSKQFVRDSINMYIPDGGTVLDPFSGVGTTLVESKLTNHKCIGFEINPYAYFVCNTKMRGITANPCDLKKEIAKFVNFTTECEIHSYTPYSEAPSGFRSRIDFYSPHVKTKVLSTLDFINQIENNIVRDLFRLAFSSTMVTYSNYSYEPSLGTRRGSGKEDILEYDVYGLIESKLKTMLDDIIYVQTSTKVDLNAHYDIINDTYFNCEKYVSSKCADLIVTSPPYLNNYHYNRNTRPQLFWLGFVSEASELKKLEKMNFGTYWQTARDVDYIGLDFEMEDNSIDELLNEIRGKNKDKGVYGGNGWANYAASYFNDCYKFAKGIDYCLTSGSTALVVIGNSIVQGVPVPTDELFSKISNLFDLETVKIHIPREKRVGDSIVKANYRCKSNIKQNLYEAIVELRKA